MNMRRQPPDRTRELGEQAVVRALRENRIEIPRRFRIRDAISSVSSMFLLAALWLARSLGIYHETCPQCGAITGRTPRGYRFCERCQRIV